MFDLREIQNDMKRICDNANPYIVDKDNEYDHYYYWYTIPAYMPLFDYIRNSEVYSVTFPFDKKCGERIGLIRYAHCLSVRFNESHAYCANGHFEKDSNTDDFIIYENGSVLTNSYKSPHMRPCTLKDLNKILKRYAMTPCKEIIGYLIDMVLNPYIAKDICREIKRENNLAIPLVLNKITELPATTKQTLFAQYYRTSVPTYANKRTMFDIYCHVKLDKKIAEKDKERFWQTEISSNPIREYSRSIVKNIYRHFLYTIFDRNHKLDQLKTNDDLYDLDAIICDYCNMLDALHLPYPISFRSPKKVKEAHDDLIPVFISKKRLPKMKIDKKYASLKLPQEFERITTTKRLKEESLLQKHCVYSYIPYINQGRSVMYSTIYNGQRYTIEIIAKRNRYELRQCSGFRNRTADKVLIDKIMDLLKDQRISKVKS